MKGLFLFYWHKCACKAMATCKYDVAKKYFEKIKRLQPDKKAINYNIGLTQFALNQYEKAEKSFLNDLRLNVTYECLKTLGDLYYVWGKRELCQDFYSKAMQNGGDQKEKLLIRSRIQKCQTEQDFSFVSKSYKSFHKGNELMKEKKYNEALKAFRKAVSFDNTNYSALNNQGVILLNRNKDYQRALVCFEKASSFCDLPAISMNIKKIQGYQSN